ncbi:hypothetical protein B484DRAFT_444354 [Ochromonadaceae sp. CCMP2298]|nr:hypothetical protein B484DRAFT_444354 [Ochromonadaceae sp. CCMP2298]
MASLYSFLPISNDSEVAVLQNSTAEASCARQKASAPHSRSGFLNSAQSHSRYSMLGGLDCTSTHITEGIRWSAERGR